MPSTQKGVVLFIALIVMVVLALTAVTLIRSSDTANTIAGNLSFKQGAISAADLGIAAAQEKFNASASGVLAIPYTAPHSDSSANCYSATKLTDSTAIASGVPPGVPIKLANIASIPASCTINVATTREVVRYVIDRQCNAAGNPESIGSTGCNFVATSAKSQSDNDIPTGAEAVPLYRVTVRVDGSKNTVGYTQAIIRP